MAENDVGGIGVKFTADAAQLKQELTSLEQRLKAFNEAHGQTKIKLQANLTMPGNRVLQEFRRDIEKAFKAEGAAGQIKARIDLLPPTAAQIKVLKGQIGKIEVDVIGNFKWGNKPPKKITVEVTEKVTTTSGRASASAGSASTSTVSTGRRASSTKAAAPKKTTVAPGGPRVSNQELFADYNDRFALLKDYLDSYVKGGSRVWMGKARDELIRQGYSRNDLLAAEQAAKKPAGGGTTGGSRGLTGGMTGAYGRGAPSVAHWSQGTVPYQSVLGGPTIAAMGRRGELPQPIRSLYNPYPQKGTAQPPKWNDADLGQLTETILARRLRSIARRITPEAMAAGKGWYQRAGEITQGLGSGTGLGRAQIAGATASFSQNAGWSENVRNAQDFFEAFRRGARTVAEVERHVANIRKDLSFNALGLKGRTQMALNAAMAETPRDVEAGMAGKSGQRQPKIRAFYRALMGDPESFTVDRHMALMMSGGTINPKQKMHTPFQRAGQRVAGEMGMSAADLQAVLWTLALGPEHAGADPYGQMRATGAPGMAGGARGFAAPAWLKSKPGTDRRMSLLDVIMDSVQPTGRPGVHIERGTDALGWRTDPRRGMYSVARNEEGTPLGALEMAMGGRGHDVRDIMPFVVPAARGQGIGKALYAHAQRAGFDVESASDRNAASAISRQTEEGQALWLSRKRAMGVDPEEVIRQTREREKIHVPTITFGGARGFAAGGGGDDPYRQNELKEARERIHKVSQAKSDADDSRHRESVEKRDRERAAKRDAEFAALTPEQKEYRRWEANANRPMPGETGTGLGALGESLGPGGQIPFGFGIPATPPAGTAAGRVRATPRAGSGGHQLPLMFPSALSAPPPVAGYAPGLVGAPHQLGAVMRGRTLAPELEALHGEMGLTQLGARFGGMPQQLEEAGRLRTRDATTGASRVATAAQLQQALRPLPTPAGNISNLDAPAYLRRQQIQQLQAAEPVAAGPGLQEFLETAPAGGGGGGGGRKRPAAGAGAGDDEVGQPRPGGRVAELLNTIEQGKYAIQAGRQAGQIRAAGTTVASQLGGLLGRGVDVVKLSEMNTILNKIRDVTLKNAKAFDALDEAKERGADPREIEGLEAALKGPNKELANLNKQFQALQPNKFAQMATGLVSSIGGTIIGLGLFQGATSALSAAGEAMGPLIDRSLDYAFTTVRVTDALSDQARAQHGLTKLVIDTQAAQIGMTAATTDYVHALLDQRVAGEAANKNLSDQIDLFFTAQKVQAENAQFGGVDKSVFQTTGGWAGTGLFGTPSAQELMGRMLDQNLRGLNIPNTGPLSQRVGLPPGALGPRIGTGGTAPAASTNPGEVIAGAVSEEDAKQAEDFAAAVDAVNSAMQAGGETAIKFKDDLGEITRGEREQALAQARLARERGLHGIAGALEHGQGRLRVEGLTGTPAQQGQQLVDAATAYQLGATKPDKAVAARLMAMQVNAQLQMNREQGRQQREWMIPGQSFLRQLYAGRAPGGAQGGVQIANPLTAGTRGLPPELLRGQFGEPGTAGAFTQNIDTSQLTTGLGLVQTQANKGRDALVGMIKAADTINQKAGVPSNLLAQFNALTEQAGAAAFAIRSINQASAWMQVNLQVKQINEQIYVMNRSLQDAKSFLSGAGEGELGLLQHRARGLEIAQAELGFRQQTLALLNQELGIQASTLQLQQRQRQINFQRAIAGFVTPGQTPEEIAARQKEAKLEADFAQKGQDISVEQLDNQKEAVALQREGLAISKEQFAVQQAMVTVSAQRAIGDLSRGIALLQEQARVTVQLQVNTEAVEAYQAYLDETSAQIDQVINESFTTHQTILTAEAQLIASYEGTIAEWNNILLRALQDYVTGANAIIAGFGHTTSPSTGTGGGGGGNPMFQESTNASGFFQSVSSPTQMTVGEAGPETIAILRNPRSMTLQPGAGGGGSGININVMVTGNNVGSEQDAEALANQIARKVEESMSRRSSLLGLRAN